MKNYAAELYASQLEYFYELKKLTLEHCELEFFAPKGIGKLEELSLEGNKITDFEQITFHKGPDPNLKKKGGRAASSKQTVKTGGEGGIPLYEVKLRVLNLAANKFKKFPMDTLKEMDETLQIVDISRNQIANLKGCEFEKFKQLKILDLSDNGMKYFPVEVEKCENLEELRLIYNDIQVVPHSFYDSENMIRNLKILILNNNPLKELDMKVGHLKELRTLGLASTDITKLPS